MDISRSTGRGIQFYRIRIMIHLKNSGYRQRFRCTPALKPLLKVQNSKAYYLFCYRVDPDDHIIANLSGNCFPRLADDDIQDISFFIKKEIQSFTSAAPLFIPFMPHQFFFPDITKNPLPLTIHLI